jgi:predicted amidophosphoribosyltransferase
MSMAQDDAPDVKREPPVSGLVDCPRCGQSNPVSERYCVNCGAHLAGAATASKEPAPVGEKKGVFDRLFGKRR